MSSYEILEVSNSTKEFESKFGKMINYSVRLDRDGEPEWVQLVQKLSSPEPKAGDKLEGSIEDSEYGPKFRKEYVQKQGYGGGSKPRAMSDSYAMYVSYAKDIVVAYMQHDAMKTLKPDVEELTDVVAYSAKKLWESRPDNNKEN